MRTWLLIIIASLLLWTTSLRKSNDQLSLEIHRLGSLPPVIRYLPMGETQTMETCMAWYLNADLLEAKRRVCSTPTVRAPKR